MRLSDLERPPENWCYLTVGSRPDNKMSAADQCDRAIHWIHRGDTGITGAFPQAIDPDVTFDQVPAMRPEVSAHRIAASIVEAAVQECRLQRGFRPIGSHGRFRDICRRRFASRSPSPHNRLPETCDRIEIVFPCAQDLACRQVQIVEGGSAMRRTGPEDALRSHPICPELSPLLWGFLVFRRPGPSRGEAGSAWKPPNSCQEANRHHSHFALK